MFTITDSGGKTELYSVDENSGTILNSYQIENAKNKDWEAITQDSAYVYIADIGNNAKNRYQFQIYKIEKSQLKNRTKLNAEIINFSYENQLKKPNLRMEQSYDAESIISIADSLMIFTKNWNSKTTDVFILSKKLKEQKAKRVNQFNVKGLVTDAHYNSKNQNLILIGYSKTGRPFVWSCKNFNLENTNCTESKKKKLNLGRVRQIEGITQVSDQKFIISSEFIKFFIFKSNAKLYEFILKQ